MTFGINLYICKFCYFLKICTKLFYIHFQSKPSAWEGHEISLVSSALETRCYSLDLQWSIPMQSGNTNINTVQVSEKRDESSLSAGRGLLFPEDRQNLIPSSQRLMKSFPLIFLLCFYIGYNTILTAAVQVSSSSTFRQCSYHLLLFSFSSSPQEANYDCFMTALLQEKHFVYVLLCVHSTKQGEGVFYS